MGTAQVLEVQHALQLVVIEVGRLRGDVAEHVLALGRLADLPQVVVPLVGENVLAQLEHRLRPFQARRTPRPAAARKALMIGS